MLPHASADRETDLSFDRVDYRRTFICGHGSLQMIEKAYFRFIPTEMSKKLVALQTKENDSNQTAVPK